MTDARPFFKSRLGFLLTSLGFAFALGSLWRFPNLAAQYGGASFVLLYLAILFLFGLPLLWAELSLGQRSGLSGAKAVESVAGKRWRWAGMLFVFNSFLVYGYYNILCGLVLLYLVLGPTNIITEDPDRFLRSASEGPEAALMGLLFVVITVLVVIRGLQHGVERANIIMMPLKYILIFALAIYGLTQANGWLGARYYLIPNFSRIDLAAVQAAINQVFFSVGTGMGFYVTAASYAQRGKWMLPNAALICTGLAVGAFASGFMIFPLIFANGLEGRIIGSGAPSIDALFLTMPSTFAAIGGGLGKVLMFVFFFILFLAALGATIANMEVFVSFLHDEFGWKRWKAAVISAEFAFVPGLFAAASNRAYDFLDALLGYVFLFLGGIALCLLFAIPIKDTQNLLLGGEKEPSPAKKRLAVVVSIIVSYVAPVILAVIFLVRLPATLRILFG